MKLLWKDKEFEFYQPSGTYEPCIICLDTENGHTTIFSGKGLVEKKCHSSQKPKENSYMPNIKIKKKKKK